MKKFIPFLLGLFCFLNSVFADDFADLFNQSLSKAPSVQFDQNMKIFDINKREFSIANCELRLNEQFYITREFDGSIIIIAKASVSKTSQNGADKICNAKLLDSYHLEQRSMPSLKQIIKQNDQIIKDINYQRALLIAPNELIYNSAKDATLEYIHPDIFIGFLAYDDTKKPKPSLLKDFCLLNDIGTLQIVLTNEIYSLDCRSFKILSTAPLAGVKTPFDTKQSYIYSNARYKLRISYEEYFTDLIKDHNKEYFKAHK